MQYVHMCTGNTKQVQLDGAVGKNGERLVAFYGARNRCSMSQSCVRLTALGSVCSRASAHTNCRLAPET
jgi:hypothetical protein